MKSKPKLIVDNLSLYFEQEVIKNISLEIFEGEIISIIGPSGCGKSTLFNIISGILIQNKGIIKIDGKEEKQRQGKFGYMFQEPLLFPWLKVLENVMLGYEVKGLAKNEARIKALDLLKKFSLFEYAGFYPDSLSGGMKQKAALLRTIAFNSSLLLLDEPFGSLDAITRSSLHLYLLEIWKRLKLTIIFTTHDIREAIFLSDRIYVLSKKPATVVDCLETSLPRPRKTEDLTSSKFVELEKKLISLLK
ncbi:MAG TPA: ABC transporter ATP-binding protein [Patescibacteria group bacterium]